MKKLFLIVSLIGLVFASCKKENVAEKLRLEAADKLMGKWAVEKIINDVHDPLSSRTVTSTTEIPGTVNDYFDFKTRELVDWSLSSTGNASEDYGVINPYQVIIGDRSWRIEKLTQSALVIAWDRNDAAQYKRFVTRVVCKR